MRARTQGIVMASLLALLWAFSPTDAAAHTCDDPFSTDLIAGQTIDAGDVKVCNDATTLTVTYETTYPWCLLATDLHVATIPDPPADPDDNIPQTPTGSPTPGEFAYGDEHDCVGTARFEIPLDEIDGGVVPGGTVVVAAHAKVDDGERQEGAWGEGTRFVKRGNWAMYFTYAVQEALLCGGETSKCVFVTSSLHTGNLGGLDGADLICQSRAESEGALAAPGTYKAWLSGVFTSAADRLAHATVPYRRVDGAPIADDWFDLIDGTLAAPLILSEGGAGIPPGSRAWTGTRADGTAVPQVCGEHEAWRDPRVGDEGGFGIVGVVGSGWSFAGWRDCRFPSLGHIYCFQQ